MKKEYPTSMSEDSTEQPHKFHRVADVKTARQNIAKRRDEKQIQLMQEALRKNSTDNPLGQAEIEPSSEIEEYERMGKINRGIREAFAEINLMPGKIGNEEAAKLINNKIAPLISDSVDLFQIKVPTLSKDSPNKFLNTLFTTSLNGSKRGVQRPSWDRVTIGDLKRAAHKLHAIRLVGPARAAFIKGVFLGEFSEAS